jgi:tetratricopeptide (TPR) repeat protein
MFNLVSAWRDWQERRQVLRDMRRLQGDQRERERFMTRDLLEEALATIELNDRRKGAAIWTSTRDRFPVAVRKSPLALQVLLKLNRYDEAEELMQAGAKRSPREIFFIRGLATVALTRGDLDLAIERYAVMRKRFPGAWEGYVQGAQALAMKDRLEEADVLTAQATERFPAEIGGFLEYARLADSRGDLEESVRRWQLIEDTFNDRPFGMLGRSQALIKLGRYEEADEILAAARFRFPTESCFLTTLAQCAQARGDIPEAVKRWKRRIERVPMETFGYGDAARSLIEMGEHAEAEEILRAAVERFPNDDGPLLSLAKFLHDRGDHAREAEVWAALRALTPDNEEGYARGAYAYHLAGDAQRSEELQNERAIRFKR